MNRTARLLRLLLPGSNPLARGTDRLQGALLIVAVGLGTVLVPVMLTFGSLTYTALIDNAARQSREWERTTAVVTEEPPAPEYTSHGEQGYTSTRAVAEWRLPNGATRAGRVPVDKGTHVGARVTIWLDEGGRPVDPPSAPSEAVAAGVLVAVTGWFTFGGLLALAYYGATRVIELRRARSWEREWTRVEPEWRNQPR